MSRIGKKPIQIPSGVTVTITQDEIVVKGSKGELRQRFHPHIRVEQKDNELNVTVLDPENKDDRALWGLFGSLLQNMMIGVEKGFSKTLEVVGVGYKVSLNGKNLNLSLGYSHPIEFPLPEGIAAVVEKNSITLSGIDKQAVGQVTAQIRSLRKPEPYKGKGIKYSDEIIRRKEGKLAKTGE